MNPDEDSSIIAFCFLAGSFVLLIIFLAVELCISIRNDKRNSVRDIPICDISETPEAV
jgi:hypothetical protein